MATGKDRMNAITSGEVARQAIESIERRYGKLWRIAFTHKVQEALIAERVMMTVLGWPDAITIGEAREIIREAMQTAEGM